MQTQKDRVDAHAFLMGRMSSALTTGDPSPAEPPDRGRSFGFYFGLVIALLVAVGFWVYGLIVPGGNFAWRKEGVLIVEEETGNRYVYLGGELRPTLNQASALLLQGGKARVEMISSASMPGVPHGAPIGIPDAPDSVPPAANLVGGPWTLCLNGQQDVPAAMSMDLTPATLPQPVPDDRNVVVASSDGRQYLVLRGNKHRLGEPSALVALGVPRIAPPEAPESWLAALPDGEVLAAAEIPGDGQREMEIAGAEWRTGQTFRQPMPSGGDQFFVLRDDGLAPMSRTEFALLSAKYPNRAPADLTAADIAAAPRSADSTLMGRLPDVLGTSTVEELRAPGTHVVCLAQRPHEVSVASYVGIAPVSMAGPPMTGGTGAIVRPNSGMLAAAVPLPEGQKKPHRFLITDRGIKYLLPDDDSVNALGYGGVVPTPVSAAVLDALPSGPTLSRAELGAGEKG
ncbi:type VII secretion protein EccB [Actinosynnema sp. CS-041913]|uniref:type VII secretion protein EccB n=1 Tax=Actinosynnema sp. CS-041913 TaxID=3239917 RepID=UPI003D923F67